MDARSVPAPGADPSAEGPGRGRRAGVLAVQGAFDAHRRVLEALGAEVVEVRRPEDLDGLDALVLPGGESTTISKMLEFNGLLEPLDGLVRSGAAVLGTCAGMIVLARTIVDGRPDQRCIGAVDIDVRRNAFGRQQDSFETLLDIPGLGPAGADPAGLDPAGLDPAGPGEGAFPAVFIRAPVVVRVGRGVEVLATLPDDHGAGAGLPVLCRSGAVIVAAFHPELSGDDRLHRLLLAQT